MMRNRCIKLTLAYDGTDFAGWQCQSGFRSVQGELERALSKMHGHTITVIGAGRTDSGVHARGQVAHFHTDIASIPEEKFKLALNKLLPRDIRIIRAEEMSHNFHARFDARYRRYKYFIRPGDTPYPFEDRYAWRIFHYPDINRLNAMVSCLKGELDCSTFASAKDKSAHKFRYLYHASFYYEGETLVFDIAANAFLWRMVRSIVGTLIELDKNNAEPDMFKKILLNKNREDAGTTAPAHGLFLWYVGYYNEAAKNELSTKDSGNSLHKTVDLTENRARLVPGLGYITE